jgi:ERCC4-type nuclease
VITIFELGLYNYTETEMKAILKRMTIVIDTREKENQHITSHFDMKRIPYISKALNYGDYSYFLPAYPEYGINRDLNFTSRLIIERKADLEELSGNLGQKRELFENELRRRARLKYC